MESFWNKVEKSDGCWVWTGTRFTKGYGQVRRDGKIHYAHRFSWELANGPIPPGLCVCHRCDNRPCVRPDHLFLGTNGDNVADMIQKCRHARGEQNGHAKLTDSAVEEARRLYATGTFWQYELAERYGVNGAAMSAAIRGISWKHVPARVEFVRG